MDDKTVEAMTSSKNDYWVTPAWLVKKLEKDLHITFTLDPCALPYTAKTTKYFTEEDNGLEQDWGGHTVFVNPPYSNNREWIKKCYEESLKPDTIVVVLLPARTDTRYFHDFCMKADLICFVKGRVKFQLPDPLPMNIEPPKMKGNSPLFPSMIAVFDGSHFYNASGYPLIRTMNNKP